MNTIPHIDVADPERIAAILADPANYVRRAIDCETLGDWAPDLGLTKYTNPSLFRVPGVAWSGQASTPRHRFWGTVEKQCDHTGMRYVPGIQAALSGAAPGLASGQWNGRPPDEGATDHA